MNIELLTKSKRVACIGTGHPSSDDFKLCQLIGYTLATLNIKVASGNCVGSDQAYAQGANAVDESLVHLYLTGPNHNKYAIRPGNNIIYSDDHPEWREIARNHHPRYDYQSKYVQSLFNRNVGIVLTSDLVIALPNLNKPQGGGTGHSMKVAESAKIPVWNIAKDKQLVEELKTFMRACLKET